jgi:hypothetical protein
MSAASLRRPQATRLPVQGKAVAFVVFDIECEAPLKNWNALFAMRWQTVRADLSPRANCGVAREKPIRLVRYKNAVPRVLF